MTSFFNLVTQYLNTISPDCLYYISYKLSAENLRLNQRISYAILHVVSTRHASPPLLYNVLIIQGEVTYWLFPGVQGFLKILPILQPIYQCLISFMESVFIMS